MATATLPPRNQSAAFSTALPALCTSRPAPPTVLQAARNSEPDSNRAAMIFLFMETLPMETGPASCRRREENPCRAKAFRSRKKLILERFRPPDAIWVRTASGGGERSGPMFVDSKSGGQKICYPECRMRRGRFGSEKRCEKRKNICLAISTAWVIIAELTAEKFRSAAGPCCDIRGGSWIPAGCLRDWRRGGRAAEGASSRAARPE
jgi:hypothetical protein